MRWVVLFFITLFCFAAGAKSDEFSSGKYSFDLRFFHLRGSSSNDDVWERNNDVEVIEDTAGTKRTPGFKISFVFSSEDATKFLGINTYFQARVNYQNFQATSRLWKFEKTENGRENEEIFDYRIRHQSISIQPFIGTGIRQGKDWSLWLFIPAAFACPGVGLERDNGKYDGFFLFSSFLEFKYQKLVLESGCGYKAPFSFGSRNSTNDFDWYFGAGYKVLNF